MAVDGVDVRDAGAVADGSLRGKARGRAPARLPAPPDGRRALEAQQCVVRALRAGGPVASPGLQAALRAHSRQPARTRFGRLGRPALAVGALVAVLAVAVLLAGGPGSAPSVAAALEIGLRPATAPAPTPWPPARRCWPAASTASHSPTGHSPARSRRPACPTPAGKPSAPATTN